MSNGLIQIPKILGRLFFLAFICWLLITPISTYAQEEKPKNGVVEKYDYQGNLKSKITYVYGLKDGPAYTYYPDGSIKEVLEYKNGNLVGEYLKYSEDETLIEYRKHRFPLRTKVKTYHSNGALFQSYKTYLVDEPEQGVFKEYYPNGQLKRKGRKRSFDGVGKEKIYYSSGQLKEKIRYSKLFNLIGFKRVKYYKNGKKQCRLKTPRLFFCVSQKYFNSKGDLIIKEREKMVFSKEFGYDEDYGDYRESRIKSLYIKKMIHYFDNGNVLYKCLPLKNQSEIEYVVAKDTTGAVLYEGPLLNYTGEWTKFIRSKSIHGGYMKITGGYKDGQRHGLWLYFDENGNVFSKDKYDEGEEVRMR